jgi:hypothetical protein
VAFPCTTNLKLLEGSTKQLFEGMEFTPAGSLARDGNVDLTAIVEHAAAYLTMAQAVPLMAADGISFTGLPMPNFLTAACGIFGLVIAGCGIWSNVATGKVFVEYSGPIATAVAAAITLAACKFGGKEWSDASPLLTTVCGIFGGLAVAATWDKIPSVEARAGAVLGDASPLLGLLGLWATEELVFLARLLIDGGCNLASGVFLLRSM